MAGSDFRGVRALGSTTFNGVVMVWHQGKARISRFLNDTSSKTYEYTFPLPYGIVEMIIAHFVDDFDNLKACSLTCRCWYIAAVPHLHHTLVLRDESLDQVRGGLKPLFKLHKLRLLPLIKELQVTQLGGPPVGWFMPPAFSRNDLRYFSALTNIHTLKLQRLNIPHFAPRLKHYFGQFSPTLRSISLCYPLCSAPRELSYFLSFFPNLDDIHIRSPSLTDHAPPNGMELFSIQTPKLRGRLTLHCSRLVVGLEDLIAVRNGLRFRRMELEGVGDRAPILLKACANTLETLRFFVLDGMG